MKLRRSSPDPITENIRRQLSVLDFQEYGRAVLAATSVEEIQAALDLYEERKRLLFPTPEQLGDRGSL